MAFIHDASVECMKSELDIFQIPPTQVSVEKSIFIEVQPIAALVDNAPLEFFISGSGEYYYDLNNTLLYISCRVVKQDNSAIADGARVALINYPLATLFNQVDVTLGDRLISQSGNLYSYRAYIETLLNYSAQTLASQFTSGLFYKDTAGHHDVRILDGANVGFKKRAHAVAHSKPVDLLGPIFSDIFNQPKLILNGLDLKIKLTQILDAFCLISADPEPLKVQILNACLYVKRVQVAPAVRIGHSQALLSATAKYAIDRACMKVYSIPAGSRISNIENLFLGAIPRVIILGFVDNEAFSGTYNKNLLYFHHYNVNHAALYLDGQQIPSQPFQPNFNIELAVREYMALAHISGKQKADCALAIDREEFMDAYTFFAFDLSADQEPGGHFSLIKTGNLRSEVRFALATPHTINMVVYGVNSSILEINNRREVLYDFY
ncbi:uncharacterized protein F54H12.2-like [Dendrobates tinctorius]|uniref:uncharacterized protein F54H12.2-like n=1 Tax=Dendrobates tinctorius TaxID=92724 RepID=UPI003CC948AA